MEWFQKIVRKLSIGTIVKYKVNEILNAKVLQTKLK